MHISSFYLPVEPQRHPARALRFPAKALRFPAKVLRFPFLRSDRLNYPIMGESSDIYAYIPNAKDEQRKRVERSLSKAQANKMKKGRRA